MLRVPMFVSKFEQPQPANAAGVNSSLKQAPSLVPKAPVEPSAATFSEGVRAASQKTVAPPVVELVVLALVPPVTVVAKLPVLVLLELVTAVALEVPALELAEAEVPEPPVVEVPVLADALVAVVVLAVAVALLDELELVSVEAAPEVVTLLVGSGSPVVTALVVSGLVVVAVLVAAVSLELWPLVLETRSEPVLVTLVAPGSSTTVAQANTSQTACRTSRPGFAQRRGNESWRELVTP